MQKTTGLAFYDLDGTLVSSNVVTQYAYFVKNIPSRWQAIAKYGKLLVSIPVLIGLNLYSRRLFNEIFYREYRGMKSEWLCELAEGLFDTVIRPAIYPGSKAVLENDRARGFRTVLVTGSLDFLLAPVMDYFGFDELISNSLVFQEGIATGEIVPPIIAEEEKVAAMRRLIRRYNMESAQLKAYSDSMSDLPMLEAVGEPVVVNPDRRLLRIARQRGWPILDL